MCAIIHFGTDGWRARVDEDFTADNVARIADAVGELWQKTNPGKTVYIGFDTRPLASEFAELAAGVLAAHGLDAVLASRPVPTPALTWAAAYDGGGVRRAHGDGVPSSAGLSVPQDSHG